MFVQRQEVELLATRALVEATLSDDERKDTIAAFDAYCEKMFPFWKQAQDPEDAEQRKQLMEMVKKPLRINLSKVYKAQAAGIRARNKARQKARIPSKFRMKPNG